MPPVGSDGRSGQSPDTALPHGLTSEKRLASLLDEAARLVVLYDDLRLANPGPFFEYYANHAIDLRGKTIEHFFRALAVGLIFDRGCGDVADPALQQLRRQALAVADDDPEYDALALIRRAGSLLGMAPLAISIREAQTGLELIRSATVQSSSSSQRQLIGVEQLDADIAVLRIYLDLMQRVGVRGLLAVLEG